MTEKELSEFYKRLGWHDWFYEYSDDHSVWQRGREALHQLSNDAKKDKRAEVLFESYKNYMFRGGEKPAAP